MLWIRRTLQLSHVTRLHQGGRSLAKQLSRKQQEIVDRIWHILCVIIAQVPFYEERAVSKPVVRKVTALRDARYANPEKVLSKLLNLLLEFGVDPSISVPGAFREQGYEVRLRVVVLHGKPRRILRDNPFSRKLNAIAGNLTSGSDELLLHERLKQLDGLQLSTLLKHARDAGIPAPKFHLWLNDHGVWFSYRYRFWAIARPVAEERQFVHN